MSKPYCLTPNTFKLSIEAVGLLKKLLAMPNVSKLTFEELCNMCSRDSSETVGKALDELMANENKYVICENGRYFLNKLKTAELNNK